MSIEMSLRQRVVVVDSLPRSREYMRRAIRGLGHAPLVFTSVHDLLAASRPIQRCALMCFSIPPGAQDLRSMVDACRQVIGPDVPVMFVSAGQDSRALKDLGRIQQNELLATPTSFADVYNALEGFMIRHGLPLAEDGLAWGPYRFFPACALVKVGGSEVWLDAPEFELALEFFHNIDRPLSSEWLRSMVPKPSARGWAKWLDGKVDQLRSQLDLISPALWEPPSQSVSGYRLSSLQDEKTTASPFVIERFVES